MFQMSLWIKQKLLSPQQCLVDQRDLIISTAMPCHWNFIIKIIRTILIFIVKSVCYHLVFTIQEIHTDKKHLLTKTHKSETHTDQNT